MITFFIFCSGEIRTQNLQFDSPLYNNILGYASNNSSGNCSVKLSNKRWFNFSKNIQNEIKLDSIITTSIEGESIKLSFHHDNYFTSSYIVQNLAGSNWQNYDKWQNIFDKDNHLINKFCLRWNTNKWDSLLQSKYFYNPDGKIDKSLFMEYTGYGWSNISRTKYEYDSDRINKIIIEKWKNKYWEKDLLMLYCNSYSNTEDSVIFQKWNNNKWMNIDKTVYYYKIDHNLDSFVVSSWKGENWIKNYRRIFLYGNNETKEIDDYFNGQAWGHIIQRVYSFLQNNILSAECKIWQNNTWIDGNADVFFDAPDGFQIAFISNKLKAYYSKLFTSENDENFQLFQNYPNPFNQNTNIKYTIPNDAIVEIKVFDVLGREVCELLDEFRLKGTYLEEFRPMSQSSGLYIYRIRTNGFSKSKTMLFLK
ncbi:MAG: T9SS type A sorting domain-containing protein [Syntrophothermus sp.]